MSETFLLTPYSKQSLDLMILKSNGRDSFPLPIDFFVPPLIGLNPFRPVNPGIQMSFIPLQGCFLCTKTLKYFLKQTVMPVKVKVVGYN